MSAVTVTYHMNRLQSLKTAESYCVTLNAEDVIDPAKVLRKIVYDHPLYTNQAIRAQDRWSEISGSNRTHYCGAYWFYGFHEDGLNSALRVARALSVEC
jgi:predicted NAD/FAD-binding protein